MKHFLLEADVILFADDTILFLAAPSFDVLYSKIHNAVSEFLIFSRQNLLTLSFSKTFSCYSLDFRQVLEMIKSWFEEMC